MGMPASCFIVAPIMGDGVVVVPDLRDLRIQKTSAAMNRAKRTLSNGQMSS